MIGLGSPVEPGALLRAAAVVFVTSLAAAVPASSLAQDEGLSILPSLGGDDWPDRGVGGQRPEEGGDGRGADEAVAPGAAGTSDVIAVGAGEERAPASGQEGTLWAPPEAAEDAGLSGGVGAERPEPEPDEGSSSLLGYLEESDEAPQPAAEPEPVLVPGLAEAGAALFGCPRSVLQGLLKAATAKADVVSSLEIEREVLTLCGERQRLVVQILTAEAELVRLWRESLEPAPAAEAEPAEAAAPAFDVIAQLTEFAGAPVLAFDDEPEPEPEPEELAEAEPEAAPRYGWASIFGVSRDLKARVSDGAEVWFVRVGDELPGGVVVDWIGVSPPAVHVVTGDEVETLPYRPDGGGEG